MKSLNLNKYITSIIINETIMISLTKKVIKMCEKTTKIEIELDQDKKVEFDIVSKAFNMTPKDFIALVLNNEIDQIKGLLESIHPKEELEDYYKHKININELKKLVLAEEVL